MKPKALIHPRNLSPKDKQGDTVKVNNHRENTIQSHTENGPERMFLEKNYPFSEQNLDELPYFGKGLQIISNDHKSIWNSRRELNLAYFRPIAASASHYGPSLSRENFCKIGKLVILDRQL